MLGIKTPSSGGYYVTFKSNFFSWDILQHDLKKVKISASYERYIKQVISRKSSPILSSGIYWDMT